jgi:hypothetical protein
MPAKQEEFINRSPDIEALRDKEYAGTILASTPKTTEVGRHCACIVRNKNSLTFRRQAKTGGSLMLRKPAD